MGQVLNGFRSWVSGLFVGIGIGGTWAPIVAGFHLGWYQLIPFGISWAGAYVSWRQYRDNRAALGHAQGITVGLGAPMPLDNAALERIAAVVEEEMRRQAGDAPPA